MKYAIISLAILGLNIGCYSRQCVATDTVTSVGGCDADGLCGVLTKKHGARNERRPVVGQEICVEREWK